MSSSIGSDPFIGLPRRIPPGICKGRSGAGRQGLRTQTGKAVRRGLTPAARLTPAATGGALPA